MKKENISFSQIYFSRNVRYFLCLSSIKRFVIIDHYQIEQRKTSIDMKFVFISRILWIPGIRGLLSFTVVSNFKVEWNYKFISNWRLEISAFRLLATHWLPGIPLRLCFLFSFKIPPFSLFFLFFSRKTRLLAKTSMSIWINVITSLKKTT